MVFSKCSSCFPVVFVTVSSGHSDDIFSLNWLSKHICEVSCYQTNYYCCQWCAKHCTNCFVNLSLSHSLTVCIYIYICIYSTDVWASLEAQQWTIRVPVLETQVQSLGQEDPLEKEMATHSSILAWRIP